MAQAVEAVIAKRPPLVEKVARLAAFMTSRIPLKRFISLLVEQVPIVKLTPIVVGIMVAASVRPKKMLRELDIMVLVAVVRPMFV